MSRHDATELAIRLGQEAEAVCRHYLSSGQKAGRYWLVGDVHNTPGRSMFVRLTGTERGRGAAGKWTDAATGQHGDMLDIIREALGLVDFKDVAEEARRFLSLPHPMPEVEPRRQRMMPAPSGSTEAARRLFAMSQPITGTLAEMYLRGRGITALHGTSALRFHPRCYYRPDRGPTEIWAALVASVTDLSDQQAGAHRTWLAPDGRGKAPVETPRRAMGNLLGNGVRFGRAGDVLAAGEGIETVLSVRSALPFLPAMSALSAGHLSAILFPEALRRLYVIHDRDPAGIGARDSLVTRACEAGIEVVGLTPVRGDHNDDLRAFGLNALRAALKDQLHPEDISRFLVV